MRVENWEAKLFEYIESVKDTPFEWGTFDCCLFSAKCLQIITGDDYYKDFKGNYKTKKGAYSLLKKLTNCETPEEIASGLFNEKNINFAARGDLILSKENTLGVCLGNKSAFVSDAGLVYLDTFEQLKVWGV